MRCVCLFGVVFGRNVSFGGIGFVNFVNFFEGVIVEFKVFKVRLFFGSLLVLIMLYICFGFYFDLRWSNRFGNNCEVLVGCLVD